MALGNIALNQPRYIGEVTETFRDYFECHGIELADDMTQGQRDEVKDMLERANQNFSLRQFTFGAFAMNLIYGPYGNLHNDNSALGNGRVYGEFVGFDVVNAPDLTQPGEVHCVVGAILHGPVSPNNGEDIDATIIIPLDGFSEVLPLISKSHLN